MGTKGLNAYVKAQNGKPFLLGHHDCFTFTNGAWHVMHGHGYADHFIGKYAGLGRRGFERAMKEAFGSADLITALDSVLCRHHGIPPRGALVINKSARPYFTGYAFGIAMGLTAVFLSDESVVYAPISDIDGAWVKCRS